MNAAATQKIVRVRREYNAWVANETMEDYALRFAPRSFRKWSNLRVATTAFGSVSFLALEAIGGAITITYGFTNALWAVLTVGLVIFLTALPISYYAARHSVDVDLLARGAGFGYIGSTITSLIYASFTFIFFAVESAIMAHVFRLCFGLPLAAGYLVSSVVIIPLVMYGVTFINRLQWWSMLPWAVLSVVPFAFILIRDPQVIRDWTSFAGYEGHGGGFDPLLFGMAATVSFSLIAQVGEQVDFLRFLQEKTRRSRRSWWTALLVAGPGWIVPGVLKQLAGAFLAFVALQNLVPVERAAEPTQMYLLAWQYVFSDPRWVLAATTLFIVLSQVKINVTNAYAGSLAWSNFFSRLTHSHPGRVVWLCFNVIIAVLMMEMGIFGALKEVLGLYSCIAIAWVGALVADLVINKPLGFSPAYIEFRRAYLYNINPVGVGATLIASVVSIIAFCGLLGDTARAFAPFIALLTSMALAPAIAWATGGKYYLARERPAAGVVGKTCCICGNDFEPEDMALCPAYAGSICSLCCTLDARCGDMCKKGCLSTRDARPSHQWLRRATGISSSGYARLQRFLITFALLGCIVTALVWMVYYEQTLLPTPLGAVFVRLSVMLLIVIGVASWWLVLTRESRTVAEEESGRQTVLLQQEIDDHRKTDAALQHAKEAAEQANRAKSRFLASMSHELRTPLNSIIGYAQILQNDATAVAPRRRDAVTTICESGEHLLSLADEILDIARIEAGQFKLRPVATEFSEFLTQIVNMFRIAADRKGIDFRLYLPDQLPRFVRMDQQRVRQILLNLIGNAIKYTARGAVSIHIRYASDIARFHVTDTGPGIRVEDIDRIFHPFQRAQNTLLTDDGTGLGLTIGRLITEQMGGELSVESELGKGSMFKLRLSLPELRGTGLPSGLNDVVGYTGVKRRVLLVDDQPDQRAVIRNLLEPLGLAIAEASDAQECMRLTEELHPDAIFMDLIMPGTDGLALCRALREQRQWRRPIIAVSANVFESDRERAATAGCDGFIGKPVHLRALLEQLQLHLSLKWVYEGESPISNPEADEFPAIPPVDRLLSIREHARLGYVRGISEEIERLSAIDPLYGRYTARLRELARQFRTSEIETLIEKTLSHEYNRTQA
jgi:signal transduction histidine kinase/CheY-like chemotaxis protein/purine-cytosine permease-like protein